MIWITFVKFFYFLSLLIYLKRANGSNKYRLNFFLLLKVFVILSILLLFLIDVRIILILIYFYERAGLRLLLPLTLLLFHYSVFFILSRCSINPLSIYHNGIRDVLKGPGMISEFPTKLIQKQVRKSCIKSM